MTDQSTTELAHDAERYKQDYLNACKTIADMHAAATGRTGLGPARGVVEDVAAVRTRARRAEAAIERVRALHCEEHGCCAHCTGAIAEPYPCATIRALDAPAGTEATEPGLIGDDGHLVCTCTYGQTCPLCRD